MNDETLDELLSAALDGNATDAELARIAQTPGAEERLTELRIAADAVSAMLPRVAPDQREYMISAAVASFEPKGVPGVVAPVAGPQELPENVVPLRSPLAQQLRSGAAMVGGIAASLVVMLFVFNVVGTNFGGSSSETESAEIALDTSVPAATTGPADANSLSADAEAFEDGDGAEQSESMPAAGSIEMKDEAAATTTEAMSQSTDFAEDAARSVPAQGVACWEQNTQDFSQLSLDPDVDPVLENGQLQIPTIDESGDLGWLVVEPNSCLFVETLPRP